MPRARKKRLADADHPMIEAITGRHYRFARKNDAQSTITQLHALFIADAEQEDTFWIEGFALTEEDITEGYKGHFARIAITKTDDKRAFTLTATQLLRPITRHPKHKRPSYPHPDWRHPLLRAIKAGRTYATPEEALAVLKALHEDFPRATIPGEAKLHIALYQKPKAGEATGAKSSPITKHLLTIEPTSENRFCIVATVKPPSKPRSTPRPKASDGVAPQGRFTAREAIKRSRRRH